MIIIFIQKFGLFGHQPLRKQVNDSFQLKLLHLKFKGNGMALVIARGGVPIFEKVQNNNQITKAELENFSSIFGFSFQNLDMLMSTCRHVGIPKARMLLIRGYI